jgi:hypothetical protein
MNRLYIIGIIAVLIMLVVLPQQSACTGPAVVKAPNHAPVIENVLFPKDVFSNMEVQVQCVASDADGDNLTYHWIAESGSINGEGSSVTWFPPEKLGTYPVSVTVNDGKGVEAKQAVEIRVVTNADGSATPIVDIKLKLGDSQTMIVDKQRARIWTTTDIICLVENAGGKPLTYSWSINGGKIMGKDVQEGKADRIGWIAPGAKGDFIIEVTVSDNEGKQAKGQINMQVFCCGN